MKKVTTAATNGMEKLQRLRIGLDLGDRSSHYCILDETGRILVESKTSTSPPRDKGGVRGDGAQSHSAGDRDALAVGQPGVEWVGARSDRGACAQRAFNRGEPAERRSFGCADLGTTGEDRSPVAVSSETPQRESASRPEHDSGASRAGASANRAGQHGTRAGEVIRRANARVQRAEHEPGKGRRAESRAANGTAAVAGGARSLKRPDRRVQRANRVPGGEELSPGCVVEAGKRRGHADRVDVLTDAGRSASFQKES